VKHGINRLPVFYDFITYFIRVAGLFMVRNSYI
jgi:hypothetical protein